MEESFLEYKGAVGSQRRVTIPRIYILTYELWEGSVVKVHLYNKEKYKEADFLARVQRGFRIQIPKIEYEDLGLRLGSVLDVRLRRVEKGKRA